MINGDRLISLSLFAFALKGRLNYRLTETYLCELQYR